MTLLKKLVSNFARYHFNPRVSLKSLSVALFAWLLVAPAAIGQIDRSDLESPSRFGAVDFPYQAIVGANLASVYSGPSEVHYATDELPAGEVVVVYRHDPNGWCAIQPPPGSFSLLPEAAVEKLDDVYGVLIQDQVQAWVGTRLGSVDKPLWQVKLRSEEEIEIIGEASWPSPDGHSTIWYQISPPAGEFRWIKIADLKIPAAAARSLPVDRNLVVDRQQARNAFTEVDIDDDDFVQKTASFGDRVPREQSTVEEPPSAQKASGFVYRSEKDDAYAAPQPPKMADGVANGLADGSADGLVQPERDTSVIDFKFRPIGKTARSKSVDLNYNADRVSAAAESAKKLPQPKLPQPKHAVTNLDRIKLDRINREQDKVAQATFQNPERPQLSAAGQWKAAANRLKSTAQGVGDQLSSSPLRSSSPDSLLRRMPSASLTDRNGASTPLSPWKTTGERSDELSNDVSLDVQWEREYDSPLVRQTGSPSQRKIESDFGAASEQVIVGNAMFSKLSPQLSKLEMSLTNEMLKRPNEWQLSDIELSVEQIYSQTNSPVERLQAQRILDKLKNCKKIRNGYAKSFHSAGETFGTSLSPSLRKTRTGPVGGGGLAAARDRLSQSGQSGSSTRYGDSSRYGGSSTLASDNVVQGLVGTGIDTNVESGALYDAHGWLTELVSEDRNNRPVYVLVNDAGKITHHIAPSPGLNLNRYLKSKVGVNGRQGYNNVLKLSHVTADAVSELIQR